MSIKRCLVMLFMCPMRAQLSSAVRCGFFWSNGAILTRCPLWCEIGEKCTSRRLRITDRQQSFLPFHRACYHHCQYTAYCANSGGRSIDCSGDTTAAAAAAAAGECCCCCCPSCLLWRWQLCNWWLGGLLVGRRTSTLQMWGSIPSQVAAV